MLNIGMSSHESRWLSVWLRVQRSNLHHSVCRQNRNYHSFSFQRLVVPAKNFGWLCCKWKVMHFHLHCTPAYGLWCCIPKSVSHQMKPQEPPLGTGSIKGDIICVVWTDSWTDSCCFRSLWRVTDIRFDFIWDSSTPWTKEHHALCGRHIWARAFYNRAFVGIQVLYQNTTSYCFSSTCKLHPTQTFPTDATEIHRTCFLFSAVRWLCSLHRLIWCWA